MSSGKGGAVAANQMEWFYDELRNRLDFYFDGTRIGHIDANGFSLASGAIVNDAIAAGAFAAGSIDNDDISATAAIARSKLAEDALAPFEIPIRNWMAEDGAVLGVAEEAGTFFVQDGTNQMYLQGEEALSETEASVIKTAYTLPHNYVAAGSISLRLVVDVTGAGTLGTCTVDASAFLQDNDGAVGSDLVSTDATAISATSGAKDFVITPTGLAAGNLLSIVVTTSVEETAGTAIRAIITKTQMLCDVKG